MFSFLSIREYEITDFAKNFAVMLRSGIAIDTALSTLADQTRSPRLRAIIENAHGAVLNGTPLSEAFEKEVGKFGPVFVSLISAGEKSGTLEKSLFFLASWFERSADLKRDVKAATLYPKLVLIAAILLGGSLTAFILPKLVPVFSQLHIELPLSTKILLALSLFIQANWLLSVLIIIVVMVALMLIARIRQIRYQLHMFYLRIPFIGSMLRNYQLALVSELFATLLKSGLSINESVGIVAEAATNVRYREALEHAKEDVLQGNQITHTIEKTPRLFPKTMTNIVHVGEESGTLDDSFFYLAEFYTKEVNAQTKKLPTVIEPALLVLIALSVGFVALSIIMPIYQLTGSIGQ